MDQSSAEKFYRRLLGLYPRAYRDRFGADMAQIFADLYRQRGSGAWRLIGRDLLLSVPARHAENFQQFMQNQTMFKNLPLFAAGAVMALPLALLLAFAMAGHAGVIGGLVGRNFRLIFTLFFYLPAAAALLNAGGMVYQGFKNPAAVLSLQFIRENSLSLAIVIIAGGGAFMLAFHDFLPCMLHGFLNYGLHNLSRTISICRQA